MVVDLCISYCISDFSFIYFEAMLSVIFKLRFIIHRPRDFKYLLMTFASKSSFSEITVATLVLVGYYSRGMVSYPLLSVLLYPCFRCIFGKKHITSVVLFFDSTFKFYPFTQCNCIYRPLNNTRLRGTHTLLSQKSAYYF